MTKNQVSYSEVRLVTKSLHMKVIRRYKQNPYITLPIYRLTRPRHFNHVYNFLKQSESWSDEDMCKWQFERIKDIVEYAYKNVPFYYEAYSAVGYHLQVDFLESQKYQNGS